MNYYTDVLKKYAEFTGRARRKEYWMFFLVNLIIVAILAAIDRFFGLTYGEGSGILTSLYTLAVLLPSLGVSIRRLHDTNRSGWWILIGMIPVIGWIVMLVFLVQDSYPGANKYGANPKGVAVKEESMPGQDNQ